PRSDVINDCRSLNAESIASIGLDVAVDEPSSVSPDGVVGSDGVDASDDPSVESGVAPSSSPQAPRPIASATAPATTHVLVVFAIVVLSASSVSRPAPLPRHIVVVRIQHERG